METNLLNGREFRSLDHLNEVTAWWLAEVADVRVHRETKRRPIDLHAEELPYLIPLPDKPYDTAEVVYRTVNAEGMVAYRQNFYSVPWRYLGQMLPLRITEEELIVYGPDLDGARPASALAAQRHGPAERIARAPAPGRLQAAGGPLATALRGIGAGGRPVPGRAARKRTAWARTRPSGCWRCWKRTGEQDLAAALERAARFGAFSLRSVERILAAQAQPKTPLEALGDQQQRHLREILDDRPVPPRPTADYEQL